MSDLRLVGPFSSNSGYSHMARAALSMAMQAGFRVQAVESDYRVKTTGFVDRRIEQERVYRRIGPQVAAHQAEEVKRARAVKIPLSSPTLFIQLPPALGGWQEYSSGPRIGWSMCEGDRLTEEWAIGLEGVDLLLAPSSFCLDVFRKLAPHIPSKKLAIPVDERVWMTQPVDCELSRRNMPGFLFFSVFSTCERKNWRMLMQAFAEEFVGDDAGLLVRPSRLAEVAELSQWLNRLRSGPRAPGLSNFFVQVLPGKMSDADLADYYRSADCYALASAEGFGLPFVEAALCGTASVALDGGGSADVVDEETGYIIPHGMKPLIGQMPHVYTSDCLFPTCEITDLKKALRRAYEGEKNPETSKAAAARSRALNNFTTGAPYLHSNLHYHVDQSFVLHEERIRNTSVFDLARLKPKYALCVGDGYGDAMASYGNAMAAVASGDLSYPFRFVHYGSNKGVGEWLGMQEGVKDVLRTVATGEEFQDTANRGGAYYHRPWETWLPQVIDPHGIGADEVALTQVHWPWGAWPIHRPKSMKLSDEAERWADRMRAELGEFILVQPYSTSSVGVADHWYYWPAFLHWLLGRCESSHLLVFCGMNKIHGLDRPGIVNLIGETPSMQHVLALANRARGVISTCNALANWTAITGTPGLIAANAAIPRADCYWARFMSTPNNTVVRYEASLGEMEKAARRWLEYFGK